MTLQTLGVCLLIIVARIGDVTLGTMRTMAIVNGRRALAWGLGFFEVLIWIYAVSAVLRGGIESPAVAIAYALGFATGNYIGITVEQMIAHGEQVVRIFTRCGPEMACGLRRLGFGVTRLQGEGRDGRVDVLFVKARRKDTPQVTAFARQFDSGCFYTVENIRYSSDADSASAQHSTARSVLKTK